jgi:hypothetical protein
MSEYEAELRRRTALKDVDVYDTMVWFLAAIDAEGYVDRGCRGPEPDLSWFEREFLIDNMDLYHKQRLTDHKQQLKRMTSSELLNGLAVSEPTPNQPRIDMSQWSDKDVINGMTGPHHNSAIDEIVKRANARRITVADYVSDVAGWRK